jgi:HD-like signal output (HDOD) protein
MVLVVRGFKETGDARYAHLEADKALLSGLLADIGLFCMVNEYHHYLERGNYLAEDIAFQIFDRLCSNASHLVLETWGFDKDFLEVASNLTLQTSRAAVDYLDIARIANHVLLYRRQDEALDEHQVEIDVTGADILYKLSNLGDIDFNKQIDELISASGL